MHRLALIDPQDPNIDVNRQAVTMATQAIREDITVAVSSFSLQFFFIMLAHLLIFWCSASFLSSTTIRTEVMEVSRANPHAVVSDSIARLDAQIEFADHVDVSFLP